MRDMCASNHAAIQKVQGIWNKPLNEMNCHLHPLDSIATSCRIALKKIEETEQLKGKLFGNDCLAANVVLAVKMVKGTRVDLSHS